MDVVHQHQLELVPHTVTIGYQHMSMEQVLKVRQRVSGATSAAWSSALHSLRLLGRPCGTEAAGCSQSSCMWSAGVGKLFAA